MRSLGIAKISKETESRNTLALIRIYIKAPLHILAAERNPKAYLNKIYAHCKIFYAARTV